MRSDEQGRIGRGKKEEWRGWENEREKERKGERGHRNVHADNKCLTMTNSVSFARNIYEISTHICHNTSD